MKNVAVLIISDQTIQNVQFIKEFSEKIGTYWFITTESMENKGCSEWICETLQLPKENVQKILVNEFSLQNITEKLKDRYQSENSYLVNITGGTKLMSIAVYDFFREKTNATIYYLTGRKNEFLNLTQNSHKETLQQKITLYEYLTSYGIKVKESSQKVPMKTFELAKAMYQEFIQAKQANIDCLQKLRDKIQEDKKIKEINVTDFENLSELLQAIDLQHRGQISRKDAEYLTGKWLEEWTYYRIKEKLQLNENTIAIGLYLQKKGIEKTENDFDVMFILKNELYIVECKTSHKINKENKLNEFIYKLDALQKEFGLFSQAFIYTLGSLPTDDNPKNILKDRLKFHRITLLTKEQVNIENTKSFEGWLNNLANG
ncbi:MULTISPECIES: Card1-like endonuclease domain-containing protein [Raineya]|uniref:DUF1887 family protein n=1 Tax=Raineya orbicola TaxID=2016530 RepID=A0A2N3IBK3_9BACT|nr:DUF1887 family CARF protein [Raineya orbicola]PKQ67669.1 hypothetical protein Rain11_1944 [Raineya orbicola]